MFHGSDGTVVRLEPRRGRGSADPDHAGEERLRRCIDPAERWVLKRRANRPHFAPGRLPVVARVG